MHKQIQPARGKHNELIECIQTVTAIIMTQNTLQISVSYVQNPSKFDFFRALKSVTHIFYAPLFKYNIVFSVKVALYCDISNRAIKWTLDLFFFFTPKIGRLR